MKKTILKILKYFFIGILSIITLINLIYGYCNLANISTVDNLPISFFEINGGSMEPEINRGSLAIICKTKYENLQLNDVITYRNNDGYTTHKIVSISGKYVTTKGTTNSYYDKPITQEDYVGKVIFSIENGGILVKIFTSPLVSILSILLIILLIWGLPILKLINRKNKDKIYIFKGQAVRFALTICLVTVFTINPLSTAAKYKEVIDDYGNLFANEIFFESNFLTEDCYVSTVSGWAGISYEIEFQINNYRNELLFNDVGEDVTYSLNVEKLTTYEVEVDGQKITKNYATEYTAVIEPLESFSGILEEEKIENKEDDEWDAGLTLYKLTGKPGEKRAHKFVLKIQSTNVNGLYDPNNPGKKIAFIIHANNSKMTGYHKELSAKFIFEVAESNSFIGENKIVSEHEGAVQFGYNIKTNNVAGSGEKYVLIYWDPEVCELDIASEIVGKDYGYYASLVDYPYREIAETQFDYLGVGVIPQNPVKLGLLMVQLSRSSDTTIYFLKKDASKMFESGQFVVKCLLWDDTFTWPDPYVQQV